MKNFHSSPRQNDYPAYANSAGKRGAASKECFNTIFLKFSLEHSIIALRGPTYSPKQAVICSGLFCELQTDYSRRTKTRSPQQPNIGFTEISPATVSTRLKIFSGAASGRKTAAAPKATL